MIKVTVVTGSRAEYGLLKSLIKKIHASKKLELQLIVTNTHLSPTFGLTVNEIKADRIPISYKVETLVNSDTPVGITKSMGLGLIGFADAYEQLKPDLLLVLGDRYEIFCAAAAAMIRGIPIAHLHGGESSEGLIDEAIRHSITKMSHLHFVAAEKYKQRVIQLGEQPERVFLVGGLGVDNIVNTKLLSKKALEKKLDLELKGKVILVTYHPVTLEKNSAKSQFNNILTALDALREATIIFTHPNADAEGHEIIELIERYVLLNRNAYSFPSLGQLNYLSLLQFADAVLGNSSSGLTEVPSFRVPSINIGNRQKGRLKALSVIDCGTSSIEIINALKLSLSRKFKATISAGIESINPYGNGGASNMIIKIIENAPLKNLIHKQFYSVD